MIYATARPHFCFDRLIHNATYNEVLLIAFSQEQNEKWQRWLFCLKIMHAVQDRTGSNKQILLLRFFEIDTFSSFRKWWNYVIVSFLFLPIKPSIRHIDDTYADRYRHFWKSKVENISDIKCWRGQLLVNSVLSHWKRFELLPIYVCVEFSLYLK